MPSDDYSVAVSGGLKLKGVNPSSKVSKHKKKKPKPPQPAASYAEGAKEGTSAEKQDPDIEDSDAITKQYSGEDRSMKKGDEATSPAQAGKTEAELRHEERRRKRVGFPC